jgi:hypothetical protein
MDEQDNVLQWAFKLNHSPGAIEISHLKVLTLKVNVAQERIQWQVLLKMVMNMQFAL